MGMTEKRVIIGALAFAALVACEAEQEAQTLADAAPPSCAPVTPPSAPAGALSNPQGVAFAGALIAVTNTNLDPMTYSPLEGSVTFIDPAVGEVVNQITTTQPNPQKVAVTGDTLVVLSTGPIAYDFDSGDSTSGGSGGLDLTPVDALGAATGPARHIEVAPSAEDAHLGAPLDLAVFDGRAYMTSATSNAVFVADLAAGALVRGASNPLLYGDTSPRLTTGAITAGARHLYVTDFNADTLHIVDPGADAVRPCAVDLGLSAMDTEGPTAPRVLGDHLYVLLGLAKAVVRVPVADLDRVAAAEAGACPDLRPEVFAQDVGEFPNDLLVVGEALYVVASGDNAVYGLDAGGARASTLALEEGSNPWSVAASADGRHLAVTEWAARAVTVIDQGCSGARIRVVAP
jgi:DNA-binding beta-propeller fold protein YncE